MNKDEQVTIRMEDYDRTHGTLDALNKLYNRFDTNVKMVESKNKEYLDWIYDILDPEQKYTDAQHIVMFQGMQMALVLAAQEIDAAPFLSSGYGFDKKAFAKTVHMLMEDIKTIVENRGGMLDSYVLDAKGAFDLLDGDLTCVEKAADFIFKDKVLMTDEEIAERICDIQMQYGRDKTTVPEELGKIMNLHYLTKHHVYAAVEALVQYASDHRAILFEGFVEPDVKA